MLYIEYKLKKIIHYITKKELFKNFIVSFILKCLRVFLVNGGKSDITIIKTGLNRLSNGYILGIFYKGMRVRKKNKKTGIKIIPKIVFFIIESVAPILSVAIEGDYYKLFRRIRVTYDKSITFKLNKNKKYSNEEMIAILKSVMDMVYNL